MGEPEDPDPHSSEPSQGSDIASSTQNIVTIVNTTASAVDVRMLRVHAARAITLLTAEIGPVAVSIVDDRCMSDLHERHCSMAGPTDVLTFPTTTADGTLEIDIAVCIDVAGREAAERGHGVERELLLYIVHGLLHCTGFDDHDEAGFAAMHHEEDRILDAIGVGRTFLDSGSTEHGDHSGRNRPSPTHRGSQG